MSIKWNKVTWYSKLAAVIIFVGTFALAFYFGRQYGELSELCSSRFPAPMYSNINLNQILQNHSQSTIVNAAKFSCADNKTIASAFYTRSVELKLSDGRTFDLPQTISADGARYANQDETIVFWNKGNTAFITENATTTYRNCVTKN